MSAAIKKQVEFYFSDSNFRKDTFLRTAAEADGEGFVPIKVLLDFNKLKALTTDIAVVAEAVKESDSVVVDEDGLRIRRSKSLPEHDDSVARTLYVKGYPVDDSDVSIDSVTEQFSCYGNILMVRMRKDLETKGFKGSLFIEFETAESMLAAKSAANDGEPVGVKLSYKGTPFLCVMALADWLERKKAKKDRLKSGSKRKADSSEGKSEGKSEKKDSDESEGAKRKKAKSEDDTQTEVKAEPEKVLFTPGLIIKVTDLPDDATLFQIKDLFKAIGNIKYVDFKTGDKESFVRVADAESAEKILSALEKGLPLSEGGTNLVAMFC